MAFKQVQDLGTDMAVKLGGVDKKTGKKNPTQIEGYFLGTREIDSKFSKTGKAALHVLQTPKGNVGVFGKTDLDRKMTSVSPGTMVRITQSGSVPTNKGNDMLKFTVEVDEDNTIEVGAMEASGGEVGDDMEDDMGGGLNEDMEDEMPETMLAAPSNTSAAAISAAERKARVQALMNKGKR